MRAILLNGPSSARKSSLAWALKERISKTGSCSLISLDDYMTVPQDEEIWEDDVFEVMHPMCAAISKALQENATVIVDHVITSQRIYDAVLNAMGTAKCLKVLISCDLETLKEREKKRGDRYIGSAESSSKYLYPKNGYDAVFDSGKRSSDQMAGDIMKLLTWYLD